MARLSRRLIAEYVASNLLEGVNRKKIFQQLAGYLLETRRTNELELIVRDIEFSLAEKGDVQAIVTSAFDLTSETKKALETLVKAKTKATKVSLSHTIDPRVLGGIKIAAAGRELDQTVAHQLSVLKTRYKKA